MGFKFKRIVVDADHHASTRTVAAIGLDNHIVVETAYAVLVAEKSHCQQVKNIVESIKSTRPRGGQQTFEVLSTLG